MTTMRGRAASAMGGGILLSWPWAISAGSKLCATVARSRTSSSSATAAGTSGSCPKPMPALRAADSARASHHSPKPSMIAAAITPRPGAAKGVVPKNGIGIAFWIAGEPGNADIVKVALPRKMAAGISLRGISAALNIANAMGARTKKATNRLTPP